MKKKLFRVMIAAAAAVLFYFLAISGVFLVSAAESADAAASAEEISAVLSRLQKKRLFYLIPQNHILVLTRARLLAALQEELPKVRSIKTFKKIFPNKIALIIEERSPLYVWQSADAYFLLDQDGVIFQQIASFSPETFSQILITDQSAAQVRPGQELAVQPILEFIEDIKASWPPVVSESNFVSAAVPSGKSQDLIARTSAGYVVYFDLERSADTQIANLKLVLSREIKPETYSGLSYIDLRLPNTAYYCYRDAPCALESELGIKN